MKYPKFKVVKWGDVDSPEVVLRYGLEVKLERGGKSMHVSKNREPLFFKTKEEAIAFIEQLKGE